MRELARLRRLHGSVFVTALAGGQNIPWKPLSVQDFLEYDALTKAGPYTVADLEDEVFCKCVLDKFLVNNIDTLKAGIVSTVAVAIFAHSGPQSVEDLNQFFNLNRMMMQGAFPQLIQMICQAFPGYTPDMLYQLDYPTLMQRAALAEDKLIKTGMIQERIYFEQHVPGQEQAPQQDRPKVDSSELFDRYYAQNAPKPPAPKSSKKQTVISNSEMAEHTAAYTGHEKADKMIREHEMVDNTAGVYDDYLAQMKDGKKLKMKSHEEKKREALARAKESERRYKAQLALQHEADVKEREELLKVREQARLRKARKKR